MLFPLLMAFLSRACGASWKPKGAEFVFAAPFGLAAFLLSGSVLWAVIGYAITYLAMQTGHGNAYHMGFEQHMYPDTKERLDVIVRPICKLLKFEPRSAGYCWLFMGLKGFLIGLALFPFGLLLAILWPFSYWVSFKETKSSELAEYMSGLFSGMLM